jgi:tetratricopeptide (TPR) repeat protein
MALCRKRRYADAAERLEAIVARDPRDAAAWLALGYCHVRLNDLSQAEIDYSMCRALSPQLYVGVYFRGLARLEMKRHAAAYDDFTETLQLAPAMQRHAEAVADFDRALELGIRHTRIYFLRARSRAALGDAESAARDRERGLEETPSDSLSYVARALERLGRDAAGARADLEAALEQDPACAVARANLAHVLSERLKETEAALGCLDQWIKSYPKDALAWGSRAVLHAREGRTLRWSQAPFTRYQAACAIALVARGDATRLERARKLIAQALDEEPALALDMRHDPDLAALRSDMRFARLIGAALVLVEESKVEYGKK